MNATPIHADPAAIDPPWYEYWIAHPRIKFERSFGDGATNLEDENGDPSVFELVPRLDEKNRLVGYAVDVSNKTLPLGWAGVTLAPRGKYPLGTIGAPLDPYDGSPEADQAYETAFSYLVSQLHARDNDYQRLEGFFPVFDDTTGTLNIDRVRIVNVPRVIAGNVDHSFVVLTLIDGIGKHQNGGGSGPPEP